MKNKLLILLCLVMIGCKCIPQCNERARNEVERNLQIVKNYLDRKDDDLSLRRISTGIFLAKLTRIYSEADIVMDMQDPTKNDYKRWATWYEKNMAHIYWNKRIKKVYLKD